MTTTTNTTITMIGWYTDKQRRALLDAAKISNLNCLRLMNDLTASALGYGITKLDLPEPVDNEKGKLVVFVDIGESSCQVGISETGSPCFFKMSSFSE